MSGPASAEIKMGVVNFQKLLEDAPQTKTAMQALENEFAPRRRELLTMQNDLKARDEKLQKEGAVMSEADRAKAEKTLRDQQREFSRKAGEFQDDGDSRVRQCPGLRSGAGRRCVLCQGSARHHGQRIGGACDQAGELACRGTRRTQGSRDFDSPGQDPRRQIAQLTLGACLTNDAPAAAAPQRHLLAIFSLT
jgi:hypothetical protein